jgi:hypothetical protein
MRFIEKHGGRSELESFSNNFDTSMSTLRVSSSTLSTLAKVPVLVRYFENQAHKRRDATWLFFI